MNSKVNEDTIIHNKCVFNLIYLLQIKILKSFKSGINFL